VSTRDGTTVRSNGHSRGASGAAAAIAALVVITGCGEDKEAKRRCIDEAHNAAEAAVVARFYDQGKLGTRKQVEKQLGGDNTPRPGSSFFNAQGHLIPYRKLPTIGHKIQFLLWINTNARVYELTREARMRAVANTHPDC
jgi:hypothetical protein